MMVDKNGNPIPCQPTEFNHVMIIPPDGYEIDKENSTFENIVFKKKCVNCYESILKELFSPQAAVYGENPGKIYDFEEFVKNHKDKIILNRRENYQKIVAISKLINVAEYLNNGKSGIYTICIDSSNKIRVTTTAYYYGQVFFNTDILAKKAIEILGEKTIRLALGK